jgi:nucleoside-diphosphate-sugar epimerase
MKRVIITGATGFVGANLTRRLLQEGYEVNLLVRPGYTSWRLDAIRPDVRLYQVNLEDPSSVASAVAAVRPDWIFHLAAYGAYSSQKDVHRMVNTNILGTINLLQACLETGFESFVNTGSSSEYGFKDRAPAENEWVEPNSHYAVTKASATQFCRYTAQQHGLHVTTLRLYSVYGPYEEPTRLLPTLIACGMTGKLPPLVDGNVARDFVYVDDVNEAYLLAAKRTDVERGAIYNVGTGVQTTIREVVTVARQLMKITAEPEWGSMPDRQWDTNAWVSNNAKLRNELRWEPRNTFEQGFRLMVDWFQQDPTMEGFYQRAIESPAAQRHQ